MKKAKVILTAIALLAIVGGTAAFKAKKTSGLRVYTLIAPGVLSTTIGGNVYTTTVPNLCTTLNQFFTAPGQGAITTTSTNDALATTTTRVVFGSSSTTVLYFSACAEVANTFTTLNS